MSDPIREHLIDGAKATPVIGYLLAWFNGVNWPLWGAFLAVVYTGLLILDKLGLLAPVKRWAARLVHHGRPSA